MPKKKKILGIRILYPRPLIAFAWIIYFIASIQTVYYIIKVIDKQLRGR